MTLSLGACLVRCAGDASAPPPAAVAGVPAEAGAVRPALSGAIDHVVLITIDTLRADHLGVYGYPRATSPFMDAFALENVLFEQAAVQWPKTTPSLASLLTGLYGHATGVMRTCRQPVPPHLDLLAERLRAVGFTTVGSVSQGNLDRAFGFDQGFDTYYEVWKQPGRPAARVPGPACPARLLTEYALQGLDDHRGAPRLFLWAHYIDAHAPYEPPPPYDGMFVEDAFFDGASTLGFVPDGRADGSFGMINNTARQGDENRVAFYVAQYDAEIRAVDEQVHHLLAGLQERGLYDRALIAITADHGESLGDHNFYFEHGMLPYDACSRVPLFLKIPGVAVPRRVSDPVALIDLLPTIDDYLGLPADPLLQGKSLRPWIEGDAGASVETLVFTESGYEPEYQRAVRSQRWKLIWVPTQKMRRRMTGSDFELYDLLEDPRETKNLIDERPVIAEGLKRVLLQWIKNSKERAVESAVGPVELDPATEAQLRELGYVH